MCSSTNELLTITSSFLLRLSHSPRVPHETTFTSSTNNTTCKMAEGTGVIKAALWAFLAFALLGWVLSIVGLAGASAWAGQNSSSKRRWASARQVLRTLASHTDRVCLLSACCRTATPVLL